MNILFDELLLAELDDNEVDTLLRAFRILMKHNLVRKDEISGEDKPC